MTVERKQMLYSEFRFALPVSRRERDLFFFCFCFSFRHVLNILGLVLTVCSPH